MAHIFKKPTATNAFAMPDLADVDPEFGKLSQQLLDLNTQKGAADRELASLREELAGSVGPSLSPGVAALLGEESADSVTGRRQRAAELSKLVGDLGMAIDIVNRRIRERRDIAKRPLIAAVREEYQRRAAIVADALEAVSEPLRALEELRRDFETGDVSGHFEWPHPNVAHHTSTFCAAVRKGVA